MLPEAIRTDRLLLRRWTLADAGDVLAYAADEAWSRFLPVRGLATEAARAVVGAAFEALPSLARVRANADARNTGSVRVLEKLGMTREGVLRANRLVRGEPVDEVWFGLLRSAREEWEARRAGQG